jgi:hypothetical protein
VVKRGRTFRALLVLGAAAFVAIGVWMMIGDTHAAPALARLYAAVMVALGLGYAIAASQPHGSRGLLVVLFAAPALSGVVLVASVARGEIAAGRGIALAVAAFAYCLLYFRTYPRTT